MSLVLFLVYFLRIILMWIIFCIAECFQMSFLDLDIQTRLFHMFGSILSGSVVSTLFTHIKLLHLNMSVHYLIGWFCLSLMLCIMCVYIYISIPCGWNYFSASLHQQISKYCISNIMQKLHTCTFIYIHLCLVYCSNSICECFCHGRVLD